jgi:hypothetical protein
VPVTDKLAILSHIEQRLAAIQTVDEAKAIHDQAKALEVYAKSAGLGLAIQNRAAAIKILAECRAGELLKAIPRGQGKNGEGLRPLLDEVGITPGVSGRWQTMAPLADRVRDLEANLTGAGKELTSALVLQIARRDGHPAPVPRTGIEIRRCDFRELLRDLRDLDAVVTDLPYGKEYLWMYPELARLSKRALKPTGTLAVMAGQAYLPEILPAMAAEMRYRWIIRYECPGPSTKIWARRIFTSWKPVLLFGERPGRWVVDVVRSDGPSKSHHPWEQSESGIARVVETVTVPGDLVCDPFAGSGTTGVVCQRLGRRCILGDIAAPSSGMSGAEGLP